MDRALPEELVGSTVDDENGERESTSSRRASKIQGKSSGFIQSASNGDISDTENAETPSKKTRKKYKGWVYVENGDELTQGDASEDDMDLDSGVGRLKRGRDDLRIDINPNQLKPRKSKFSANGVRVGTDKLDEPPNGTARRKSKRTEIEDEGMGVEPVVTLSSEPKRKYQKKRPSTIISLPREEDEEGQVLEGSATKDGSPDELAQGSGEEGDGHDSITMAPTSTAKRRKAKAGHPPMIEKSSSLRETSAPGPQEPFVLDNLDDINGYAKNLQIMLENDPESLNTLRTHILSSLTGKRRLPLKNLEDEHQKVLQLVEQTVLAGEGNSMLIIGSRGSGKTILVETVISELAADHQDDFHVVRLNGFIHTDDKLALREIWRQLGREMDVENDDLGGRSNYADTLTSLLALLAHTAEEGEENRAATARSVVFVLDEFDLFASHPRQTLLYNLFDVAQSRNAPVAVLGLTTKVNVVDSLEKRVKSRFGQRYVHLSLPKNFSAFQAICLSVLEYHPSTHDLLQHSKTDLKRLSTIWNDHMKALFLTPSLQHFLKTLYTSTKSIPAFLNSSLLPIVTLSPINIPSTSSFTTHPLSVPDSQLSLLSSLSTLSLSLLIAAARLDIILSTDVCTFGMVYDEYVALASKSKLQSSAAGQMAVGGGARVWSMELAKGSWELLGRLELVLPAVGGSKGAGRGQLWRVDVGLEEIGGVLEREGGKGGALGKWCREI